MGLEFEEQVLVFGKFGEACDGSSLDWRRKCRDEIIEGIPVVLVDQHFDSLPYRALISAESSINFREAWESEGGTDNADCCPSTANTDTTFCDLRLPALKDISIGTQKKCYTAWAKEFCERYPRFRATSPFVVSGGNVSLRPSELPEVRTFVSYVQNELAQASWQHFYRTFWAGTDAKVDQFNGLLYYLENGISALDQGDCGFPLTPFNIDWAEYIHGAAAAAAGTTAGWGDVVLAVGDADRPVDAPVSNIITIHAGTLYETTLDITGFDAVDLLTAWYEYLVNEWDLPVQSWMLGIPRNGYKCPAQVAACKQACSNGNCRSLLTSDTRDVARADREASYIRERAIRLYPYEDSQIMMKQSDALRDLNRVIFLPESWLNGEGETEWWLLWAWRNRALQNGRMFADHPMLRDALSLTNGRLDESFDQELIYDGQEFGLPNRTGGMLDAMAFDWLWERDCNAVHWWFNAEAGLVPQAPWYWLVIDGLSCDTVITQPFCGNVEPTYFDLEDDGCVDETPDPGYTSQITLTITGDTTGIWAPGDYIDYLSANGTTYRGIVVANTGGTPTSTVEIGFVSLTVTCLSGGGSDGGQLRTAIGTGAVLT